MDRYGMNMAISSRDPTSCIPARVRGALDLRHDKRLHHCTIDGVMRSCLLGKVVGNEMIAERRNNPPGYILLQYKVVVHIRVPIHSLEFLKVDAASVD